MNKLVQTGLVITLAFLSAASVGQTQGLASKPHQGGKKIPQTYLDLMVNVVSTNFNYGEANSTLENYKRSNMGVQAGASFQAGITPALSVVSELYFMRKGGKLMAGNPLTGSKSSLKLNTIELPLLARFHFGRFYMNAGPSIAYILSGSMKLGEINSKLSFANSSQGFKRFDTGVQLGGGLELPFKSRRIVLDLRYNYGLTNITYNNELRNRALMVSLHFSKPWKTNPLAKKLTS